MKYVLDASVALKWVLNEPDSPAALKLRADFSQHACELLAPDIILVEIAHSLTRAERRGIVTQPAVLFGDILSTRPDLHPHIPLLPRAIGLSSQLRIGVYDCLYLALAERERCEVVTADGRLARVAPGIAVELSSLP